MASTSLKNDISLRGDVTMRVRNAKTGELLRRIEIRNTITYEALQVIIRLLAQRTVAFGGDPNSPDPDPAALKFGSLRVGTGTTPPNRGNTALENEVHSIELSDTSLILTLSNPFEIRVVATLEAEFGNGSTLTEAGLYTAGSETESPVLFARQVHAALPKSEALVIDYDWRIALSA